MGHAEQALVKSQSTFELRLEGENEIDASLLAKTIADMAELTKIATKEENADAYIKINVTAFKNGSFQIDFSTIVEVAETMYHGTVAVAGLALTVVGIVKGIFEIKKFLKGNKAKSVEKKDDTSVRIEDDRGNKLEVPKSSTVVLNNVQADQLTVNVSNYIQEHNPEGGFTLSTHEGSLICTNDDVRHIAKALPIEETTTCQRTQVTTKLIIKKADVMGKSAWDFYFNDKRITAHINDEEWLDKLHARAFAIGYQDMIHATLEIYVDLDIMGHPVDGSERYTITKVFGDIEHAELEQITL